MVRPVQQRQPGRNGGGGPRPRVQKPGVVPPDLVQRGSRADRAPAEPPVALVPPALKQAGIVRELAAGEALFRQGDAATAIFEIEQGRLRLLRQTDHRTVPVHTARPGELFAEAALFSATYHCDAIAAVASRVRAYPKRQMLAALRSDPKQAEAFMAALARQVQTLRTRLEQRNIRSARERVMHYLALAAGSGGRTVYVAGTLMDLAAELGLTHEALYRTLAALEKDGRIARAGDAIIILGKKQSV